MPQIQLNFNKEALAQTKHDSCSLLNKTLEQNFDATGTKIISPDTILFLYEDAGKKAISGLQEQFGLQVSFVSDTAPNLIGKNSTAIYDVTAPQPEQA